MIITVFVKELKDYFRDRRSALSAMAVPIAGPILLLGLLVAVGGMSQPPVVQIPTVGAVHAPLLLGYLRQQGAHITRGPDDPELAVRERTVDLVLRIGHEYQARMNSGQTAPVELIFDATRASAGKSAQMIAQWINEYSTQLGDLRLAARGVAPTVGKPIEFKQRDVSSREQRTARLLQMVPLLLMLAALVGGMGIAVDATAGERERGSLEPLLLNGTPLSSIIVGKWLATFATAALVTAACEFSLWLVIAHFPLENLGLGAAFGLREGLLIFAAMLPLAALGAAAQMLLATFARSFKEAQTYVSLLDAAPMVPGILVMITGLESSWWLSMIPTLAQHDMVSRVLGGEGLASGQILLVWVSSAVLAIFCLRTNTKLLRSEKVIFGRT